MTSLAQTLSNKEGFYHLVGFTGNPVGVAQDLQLHISLKQTAAGTDRRPK